MISVSQLFISNAYADGGAPAAQGGGDYSQILFLVAMLAIFFFLIVRPQQKRAKEHKALVEALQKGDEVITIGGILGKVTKVGEVYVAVEIADNIVVQVQKEALQNVLPKGSIKSI